ncbi:FGGY-family carbohydrate kinase [Aeromicrobium sp. CTD01-1L150]|uniref:FGGY-family carbohydrate kinase n=1 Tax=Aeromicrobium sp. CTD01-1L150 TaxID=3341830 RepID=UPI0035C0F480
MVQLLIGLDIGTYEAKGVLVDADGDVRAEARHRHGVSTPAPGMVEHDAEDVWWSGFVTVVRELMGTLTEDDELIGLGCSAIGPCVLPVDEHLRPLRPAILYGVDTRATAEIAEIEAVLGTDEILRRSGNVLTSQSAGPKVRWVERHEPEVAAQTRWYLTSQSFLVARLTGRVVIDHATAGYFHPFYELGELRWNAEGLEALVPPEKLPDVAWSSDIAGTVTAEASRQTNLPEGLPVVVGTTDAPAEAIGSAVVETDDLMLMIGSSGFLIRVCDRPVRDERLWAAPWVLPGRYVLAGGTSTAGTATRWIAEQLDLDELQGDQALFTQLMALARSAPVGAGGVLHLPHLSGERTPFHDPDARGAFIGLSLSTGRAELARSVSEGVGHSLGLALSTFAAAHSRAPRVKAVGGGTRNEIITRVASDVSGFDLDIPDTLGASYGDAILAGLGVGAVSESDAASWVSNRDVVTARGPDDDEARVLRRQHREFTAAYQALRGMREATTS